MRPSGNIRIKPKPSEVWYADLGMVEKGRPVLVLAYPQPEDARALVIVAPLTSQIRGSRGEINIGHPHWLSKISAINIQGLASLDKNKLTRKLGTLSQTTYQEVKDAIRDILDL